MSALYLTIGLVVILRLAELWLANHNTRKLKAEGGVEIGAGHYPLFILLHGSWLLAIVLLTPEDTPVNLWLLSLFMLLQLGRLWVITSLGKYWTTRIITLPEKPLVKKGPYRFLRHPNYLVVTCEIAVLPLVFGNWQVAIIWSLANAMLLFWRIQKENSILRSREMLYGEG